MKPEIKTAHFKISLKQIAINRLSGTRSEKYKQHLNDEINWRAKYLFTNRTTVLHTNTGQLHN